MSSLRRGRWCLVPLLAVLGAGCDLPGQPNPDDRPVPADQVADFGTLYRMHCAGCHGADGKLGPAPPLNDPLFLAIVPDAELLRVIREGRAVTPSQKSPMPAFGVGEGSPLSPAQARAWAELKEEKHADPRQQATLTTAQIEVLANGIRTRWGPPVSPPGSVPPYLAPAGTSSAKKDEGARVFARACACCHGDNGQGTKEDAGRLNDPAFLALISDQELRRIVITGRPDLGMPDYKTRGDRPPDFRPLTSEKINGLVALLACWRQGGSANGK